MGRTLDVLIATLRFAAPIPTLVIFIPLVNPRRMRDEDYGSQLCLCVCVCVCYHETDTQTNTVTPTNYYLATCSDPG